METLIFLAMVLGINLLYFLFKNYGKIQEAYVDLGAGKE